MLMADDSGFVEFASAMSSGRIVAVQNVIANESGDYEPSHDFYRGFRLAVTDGIANGDDVLRVRRAVESCHPRRRGHYQALEQGWSQWRRGKDLETFARPRTWASEGLTVRVSPQFMWRQRRGDPYLVWPYLKDAEMSRDGIQAAIRLIELTHDSQLRPVLLDVRRARIHQASRRRRRGFDAWLTSEAAAFVSLLESIRDVA
jgi:hypothetical protein